MVYLLNSPVLTDYGIYSFWRISLKEAKELIKYEDKVISAIGHEATAKLLSQLLGTEVQVNRIKIEMKPGDVAIVFRLLVRLPEGQILDTEELMRQPYELAILRRVV